MFHYSKKKAAETGNLEVNSWQFEQVKRARNAARDSETGMNVMDIMANHMNRVNELNGINVVRGPADLYKAFDQQITRQFEQVGEFALLDRLMPLSRSVRINQTVYEYVRSGGHGWAHTSMSGQIGAALDTPTFDYDGTMVPVHDTGFKFEWRDSRLNNPDALDILTDAQAGSVDTIKRQAVSYIWDGFRDGKGNFVQVDGKTWKGLRGDERVAKVDLSAGGFNIDFTSGTVSAETLRNGFIALRDVLRITNRSAYPLDVFVSTAIMSNLERYYSDQYASRTILQELTSLTGIASIQEDSQLQGNQILMIPLASGRVAPIVGSAFATVADPRPFYNSDYVWRTWGAMGLMVKTDINDRYSVMYASS